MAFLNFKKFQKVIRIYPSATQQAIVESVIQNLEDLGPGVSAGDSGRALGQGLYEFKLRLREEVLLRVFFTVRQGRAIVVLSAFDKKRNDSKNWQNQQIVRARKLIKSLDFL